VKRCGCLVAALPVRDALQASIKCEELRVGGEGGREREGVGKTQRSVSRSELRGVASQAGSSVTGRPACGYGCTLAWLGPYRALPA
jgi:hypothetical protein